MVILMVMKARKPPPSVISAADFKATCLDLMDSVAESGRTILVTKRGRPVALLAPVRSPRRSAFGLLKGRIKIQGDIVAPIDVKWDAST